MNESEPIRKVLKGRMLLSILWGILILPSLFFFVASVFMFEDKEASQQVLGWIGFLASFTLPVVLLICCIGGIIVSRGVRTKRKNLIATVSSIVPVVAILCAALIFIA